LSAWRYATRAKIFREDYTADLYCPEDACSTNKCGFQAQCINEGNNNVHCKCHEGYSGNPYVRCYPTEPPSEDSDQDCSCKELIVASTDPSLISLKDILGKYFYYGSHQEKPVYQHQGGIHYIYSIFSVGWFIGDVPFSSSGSLYFGHNQTCPYKNNHNIGGKFWNWKAPKRDWEDYQNLSVECNSFTSATSLSGKCYAIYTNGNNVHGLTIFSCKTLGYVVKLC